MTPNSAEVSSIIAGPRKVPVTVVSMADYRRTHSGAPELIVKTLASLIRRAHAEAPMTPAQQQYVDTAAGLVRDFGPLGSDEVRFGRTLMHCFGLLDRHEPSVELDDEITRECAWLLGCSA